MHTHQLPDRSITVITLDPGEQPVVAIPAPRSVAALRRVLPARTLRVDAVTVDQHGYRLSGYDMNGVHRAGDRLYRLEDAPAMFSPDRAVWPPDGYRPLATAVQAAGHRAQMHLQAQTLTTFADRGRGIFDTPALPPTRDRD